MWHYPKNGLLPSKLQVVLTHSRVIELGWFLEGFLNIRSCQQKMTQALRAPNVTPFPAKHSNVDTWFHIIPCVDHVSLFWNTCPHIRKLRLPSLPSSAFFTFLHQHHPMDPQDTPFLKADHVHSWFRWSRVGEVDNPWISLECCEIQHNNILIPPLWMIQGLLKPPVPGEQQSMSAPRQRNQLQENQGRWHSTYIYLIIFGPRTCCVLFDPRKNISTKSPGIGDSPWVGSDGWMSTLFICAWLFVGSIQENMSQIGIGHQWHIFMASHAKVSAKHQENVIRCQQQEYR